MEAFAKAEKMKKPHWKEMFTDVYKDIPDHLRYGTIQQGKLGNHIMQLYIKNSRKQMDDMEKVIETHPDAYPMSNYADGPDPTAK